jgi:hypothetical protein
MFHRIRVILLQGASGGLHFDIVIIVIIIIITTTITRISQLMIKFKLVSARISVPTVSFFTSKQC